MSLALKVFQFSPNSLDDCYLSNQFGFEKICETKPVDPTISGLFIFIVKKRWWRHRIAQIHELCGEKDCEIRQFIFALRHPGD
jgi:hypothetical protein